MGQQYEAGFLVPDGQELGGENIANDRGQRKAFGNASLQPQRSKSKYFSRSLGTFIGTFMPFHPQMARIHRHIVL